MGWSRGYRPVYVKIQAEGRQTDPTFGCTGFQMDICVGPSTKHSRVFASIEVTYNKETNEAKLYLNRELIKTDSNYA